MYVVTKWEKRLSIFLSRFQNWLLRDKNKNLNLITYLVFLQCSWFLVGRGGSCGGLGGGGLIPGGGHREVHPWHPAGVSNAGKIEFSLGSQQPKKPSVSDFWVVASFFCWPVVRSLSVLSECNFLNFSLLKWQRNLLSRRPGCQHTTQHSTFLFFFFFNSQKYS